MIYRELRENEIGRLEDFLYWAIFQPDPEDLLPRSVIHEPRMAAYIDGWAENDGVCLVAERDRLLVGAAWARILADPIRGYGSVDDETPELIISVDPAFRGQGIGGELLRRLMVELGRRGFSRLSLSVHMGNRAAKLYERSGFVVVEEKIDEYIMVAQLCADAEPRGVTDASA